MQTNKDQWVQDFHVAPNTMLSFNDPFYYEVRYHHTDVQNNLFVVVSQQMYPPHPLGERGYIYALDDLQPVMQGNYSLEKMDDNIYCYRRD